MGWLQVTRRRNPFPGVSRVVDRHGKPRWRFRRGGLDTYLPGPYASAEFRAAYEAALEGAKAPNRSTAAPGTFAWLIERYLGSVAFTNLSPARRTNLRGGLDWLREEVGRYPFAPCRVGDVERIMGKKAGPAAANNVRRNLSLLFNFALRHDLGATANPARAAQRRKMNADGFHTWTDDEVTRYLERHGPGTTARLALLLALNTGMARQDLTRAGWQDVAGWGTPKPRIVYRRGKTGVGADLPILPALAEELARVPRDRLLFLTHGAKHRPYKPETLGNWFRDRCAEAKVPGALHGLRKAGATRLADAGASEHEIMAFLAHASPREASTYTKKASRVRLADSGLAKLGSAENVTNLPEKLDKEARK